MKIKRGDRGRGQRNSLRFAIGAALAQEHGAVIKSRREPAAVRRPGERRDGRAVEAAVRTVRVDFIEPHGIRGFAGRFGQPDGEPISISGKSEAENWAWHIQMKC